MFFDGLAMLVVTLPVVFPIISGLGSDPIWFGVICVIVIEMGLITRLSASMYSSSRAWRRAPMATIFRGVFLLVAMAVCPGSLVLFPISRCTCRADVNGMVTVLRGQ